MEENIPQIPEIIKRKRGRPRKNPIDSSESNNSINSDTNSSESTNESNESTSSTPVKLKRVKKTPEEKKEFKRLINKRYYERDDIQQKIQEKRKTYVNDTLPLTMLEEGCFQCNICKSIIASVLDYRIHVKTKRHLKNADLINV